MFRIGDKLVVKLFPADERAFFETERDALERIDGRLSIPTPKLVADGTMGGWHYVVMTQLRGQPLSDVWSAIDREERIRIVRATGAAIAELHALPVEPNDAWPRFVSTQRAKARERQAAKGLDDHWLAQVDDFLSAHLPDSPHALLHTEVMREHLLAERGDGGWVVTGLVDFEPSMVGASGYELASVGIFVTCGEPGLLETFFEGYGNSADACEIMAWALLHRYSNLKWYIERLGVPNGVRDLEALARAWFS